MKGVHRSQGSQGPKLAAIILAPGRSSRLGKPKQLVKIRNISLVEHAIANVQNSVDLVYVVTGAYRCDVAPTLQATGALEIFNSGWSLGMGASIAEGVRRLPESIQAVFLLTCDQYRLEEKDFKSLVTQHHQNPDKIIAAGYQDTMGIPCLFPRPWFSELTKLSGEGGAKTLLKENLNECKIVSMEHAKTDLDWPWQLEAVTKAEVEKV